MSDEQDSSQKTEEPTQRRLDDARKKGQVATSREISHWLMILGTTIVMVVFAPAISNGLSQSMLKFVEAPHAIATDLPHLTRMLTGVLADVGMILFVPTAVLVVAAIGGGLVQHGPMASAESIHPKLERISLGGGAKRLFSLKAVVEFVKGIAKIAIVAAVVTLLLLPEFGRIERVISFESGDQLSILHRLSVRTLIAVLSVMTFVAGVDFIYQRISFMRQMRMSRQEMRDEMKQTEGDPSIRGRLRQMRRERARRRMMAQVPSASVVIANPTHFAIALKYDMEKMAAPVVVAKGVDAVALRIREVAEQNGVPIVRNPPLAQALYANVEIDEPIPAEHFKAVAEVIGYVFRLQGKLRPASQAQQRQPVR
jgi:flagellar biosynthetic protein FlhB